MSPPRCGAQEPVAERPTVGAALRRLLPAFSARYPASPNVLQVLRRLSRCHTGAAGWSLWQCTACRNSHWRPLGCGDRHCPECQTARREAWLAKQRAALLPVRYFHWDTAVAARIKNTKIELCIGVPFFCLGSKFGNRRRNLR